MKQTKKTSSSSKRTGKSSSSNEFSTDKNGFETYGQTSADSDTSSNATSESQSESESTQATEDDLIDKIELESTKNEIYSAVKQAYQLTGQEQKEKRQKITFKMASG